MKIRQINSFIFVVSLVCLHIVMRAGIALSGETISERVTAEIRNSELDVTVGEAETYFGLSLNIWMQQSVRATNFEFREMGKNVYHLRNTEWQGLYWMIDTAANKVYRVKDASFGKEGGKGAPIEAVQVVFMDISPEVRARSWLKPKYTIRLLFNRLTLDYDTFGKQAKMTVDGDDLLARGDWDIRTIEPNKYQFQVKAVPNPFLFEIEVKEKKAYQYPVEPVTNRPVGRYALAWIVNAATLCDGSASEPASLEDIEMASLANKAATSPWIESEKKLYFNLMKEGRYDVLVVPFQVQGYAIDRIGRSLMTRYLAHRIETTTGAKLPSPSLVAKTLGELSRTISDREGVMLAATLGVKTIIRGYVGHDRKQRMTVTIEVLTFDKFNTLSSPALHTWKDIPISDEMLPEDVFAGLLDEVMTKLPLKQTRKAVAAVYKKESGLSVPDSLLILAGTPSENPIRNAYALQLLGSLYPEPNEARESLFERSLVALSDVSQKSPDYPILKTRAYYYLHRRPAALAALGSASGPEAKALRAVLMGNVLELQKLKNDVKEPLPRLLAQIEYVDLSWALVQRVDDRSMYDETARTFPAWKDIIHRRFDTEDPWQVQSNDQIKVLLDKMLPVPGATAEEMMKHRAVMGKFADSGNEMELSVYFHRKKLLENQGAELRENESGKLVKRDILDLLAAIGESNMLKHVRLTMNVQGLYDNALSELDRYDTVFRGHPDLTTLRGDLMFLLVWSRPAELREDLNKKGNEIYRNSCTWYQGQSGSREARSSCGYYFKSDFPQRSYWAMIDFHDQGDRDEKTYAHFAGKSYVALKTDKKQVVQKYDVALKYTAANFALLEKYYNYLKECGLTSEAEDLLKANTDRFIGSPARVVLFAKLRQQNGDLDGAARLYREAIASQPREWDPYDKLGAIYIRQGDPGKAADLYLSYPLFKRSGEGAAGQGTDTVRLSNYAYDAADALFWKGAIEESMPLFRLSAGFQTGSGREMLSEATLRQLEQDYAGTAKILRDIANRYNSRTGYRGYASFLHAMGFPDEAWLLFNKREMIKDLWYYMTVPLVGHRVEGKTEEEQRQWFLKQDLASTKTAGAQEYLLVSHLYDRDPEKGLPDIIADMDRKLVAARNSRIPETDQKKQSWETPRDPSKKVRSQAAWFADAYSELKKKRYGNAYALFKGAGESEACNSYLDNGSAFVLPYSAWSAVKNGTEREVEKSLASHKKESGETFYYHLAKAFLAGGRKDHRKAVDHLQAARFTPHDKKGFQPFSNWYQLVEACEWLYEDSGDASYRELALSYAKICQTLRPYFGWPYAVEAKYTNFGPDRRRALALALYLDKRSERVSGFSEQEKKAALEWLGKNNPFRPGSPQQEKRTI